MSFLDFQSVIDYKMEKKLPVALFRFFPAHNFSLFKNSNYFADHNEIHSSWKYYAF